MSTTPDRIEREIVINASPQRVWEVLTTPEHVGIWFGTGRPTEIDLRPGGIMLLQHGDDVVFPTVIQKVDPPNYFAYRWASAYPGQLATEQNSTLVEFTLTPQGDSTRLELVESGFTTAVLPAGELAASGYESHSTGWTEVLNKFLERVGSQ